MPKDGTAAEQHENAAKSHRAAAEHHGKGEHAKGRDESTKAQGHSKTAREHSETALGAANRKSKTAGVSGRGGLPNFPGPVLSRAQDIRSRRGTVTQS
jgi:hypothetical protein